MAKTSIEWTNETWNPVRGCSRISPGCERCYAEGIAARFSGPGLPFEGFARRDANGDPQWTGKVGLVEDALLAPLSWRKPRSVFVNSMSDLFHERFADEEIDRVWTVMLLAPQHTFQVLTKRAERARRYLTDPKLYARVLRVADEIRATRPKLTAVGISNPSTFAAQWIWLGVSVENQSCADARIPELLATPAGVRFVSAEPLLGPVDLWAFLSGTHRDASLAALGSPPMPGLDWVIAGAENTRRSPRAMDEAWVRTLRDQCATAGTSFFYKQRIEAGRKVSLPMLDGVRHDAFPLGDSA